MSELLLKTAAEIFHKNRDEISLKTRQDELEEWTSFAHIALLTVLEEQHGFVIPIEDVERITVLEDFLKYSEKSA